MPALGAQRILFAAGGSQQGVAPQLLVVVDIIATPRLGIDALGQQAGQGVFHEEGMALIPKTVSQSAGQSQGQIHLAQEEGAAVCGERAARKIGSDFSVAELWKEHGLVLTVCRRSSGGGQFHLAQYSQAFGRTHRDFGSFRCEISGLAPAQPLGLFGSVWGLGHVHSRLSVSFSRKATYPCGPPFRPAYGVF